MVLITDGEQNLLGTSDAAVCVARSIKNLTNITIVTLGVGAASGTGGTSLGAVPPVSNCLFHEDYGGNTTLYANCTFWIPNDCGYYYTRLIASEPKDAYALVSLRVPRPARATAAAPNPR